MVEIVNWVSLKDIDEEQTITSGSYTAYYYAFQDSIRNNRYCFTGIDHTKHSKCIPVFNDGHYLVLDERALADWMAMSWNLLRDDKGNLHCFDWRDFYTEIPSCLKLKYPKE